MIAFGLDKLNYNFVNEFSEEKIFLNRFYQIPTTFIQENSTIYSLKDSDIYRPDKIAFDVYGDDMYYPCILAANNLGSVLSFKPDRMNYECYIPDRSFIETYLTKPIE